MLVATTDPWQTGRVHRVWPLIVAGVLAVVAATASHAGKPALVLVRGKEGAVLVSPAGYALDCTVDKGTIEVGMACTLRDGSGHVVEKSYVVGIGSDNSVSLGQIRAGVFTPINKWKGRGPKTPAFGRFVKDPIARVVGVRLGRFYGFSGTSARCTVPTIQSLACVIVDARGKPVPRSYGFVTNFFGVSVVKLDAKGKPRVVLAKRHGH